MLRLDRPMVIQKVQIKIHNIVFNQNNYQRCA
jgi:hypothetical protein